MQIQDITIEEVENACFTWALCEDIIYDFAYEDENIDIKVYHPFQILVREGHVIVEIKHIKTGDKIERKITYKELTEAINKMPVAELKEE